MDTKICTRCDITKNIVEFKRYKTNHSSGYRGECLTCYKKWQKAYHTYNKEERNQSSRDWRNNKRTIDPSYFQRRDAAYVLQRRAAMTTSYSIRTGKIKRPTYCSSCGDKGKIEGHHPNYNKPLEIVWLCFPCHNAVHVEMRAALLSG